MKLDEYLKRRNKKNMALSVAEGKAMGVDPTKAGWMQFIHTTEVPQVLADAVMNGATGADLKALAQGLNRCLPKPSETTSAAPAKPAPTKRERAEAKHAARVAAEEKKRLAEAKRAAHYASLRDAPKKPNTVLAAELIKSGKVGRIPVGALIVEGVDVRSKDFLSTYAWTNLRIKVLNTHGRKCMCCGDSPENGAVMNVDHIQPRLRFPSLALDARNLQVLCGPCNKGKCNELETDYRTPAQIAAAVALAKTL